MAAFASDAELLGNLTSDVQGKLMNEFHFSSIRIPDDSDDEEAVSSILVSANWQTATRAVLIIQNAVGSVLGVFSRSVCLDQGLERGSMIPYVRDALGLGYAVIILRPNLNSVMVGSEKRYIRGSENPEAHCHFIWENIIAPLENLQEIVLLGYGNGAALCKDLFLRQMVRTKENDKDTNKITGIITLNASHFLENDDANDIRQVMGVVAVNLESSSSPLGYRLKYRQEKLGCETVSLGSPDGAVTAVNDAAAIFLAICPVAEFLKITADATAETIVSNAFCKRMAELGGVKYDTSVVTVNPSAEDELAPSPSTRSPTAGGAASPTPEDKRGFFARMFGGSKKDAGVFDESSPRELTINDFDLLKVVGKGAFGKVMLVRKKAGTGEGSGNVYAMKVLKKSVIAAKGQIEHTKSERAILCEVTHPFIVHLRFAFQNAEKLYLVTDYYNSGTLFYHLRKALKFPEARAKFYACELLSALEHLHSQNIIYRDLKLENILMSHNGHIALTDFGLSKQNVDASGGATTFCGTAEYLAPELLKNLPYGPPVDFWSFGILIYEMLEGKTPFFDKNRKNMFYSIVARAPSFSSTFSPAAISTIKSLLSVDPETRLGSDSRGARAIMESPFFQDVDFQKVFNKEVPVPFKPDVSGELDTKYVPKAYLMAVAEDSMSDSKPVPVSEADFTEFAYPGEETAKRQQEERRKAAEAALDR